MPWTQNDAERHTRKATTPALKELWARDSASLVRKRRIQIASHHAVRGGHSDWIGMRA
jgi:hypothetical protein